jgi:hypothetical protein
MIIIKEWTSREMSICHRLWRGSLVLVGELNEVDDSPCFVALAWLGDCATTFAKMAYIAASTYLPLHSLVRL